MNTLPGTSRTAERQQGESPGAPDPTGPGPGSVPSAAPARPSPRLSRRALLQRGLQVPGKAGEVARALHCPSCGPPKGSAGSAGLSEQLSSMPKSLQCGRGSRQPGPCGPPRLAQLKGEHGERGKSMGTWGRGRAPTAPSSPVAQPPLPSQGGFPSPQQGAGGCTEPRHTHPQVAWAAALLKTPPLNLNRALRLMGNRRTSLGTLQAPGQRVESPHCESLRGSSAQRLGEESIRRRL